jgi:hypothetical protein
MKKFTTAELKALKDRCIRAMRKNFRIAHVDVLINMLGAETNVLDVPPNTCKGSTKHLYFLVEEALAQKAGKAKPANPAKTAIVNVIEIELPGGPVDEIPYDEWEVKELYSEARARNIYGRSNMGKDELIKALYKYDEELN